MKPVFCVLISVLLPLVLPAQLQVTPGSSMTGWNADSLVRNVLLGQGVEVFNVRYNGQTGIGCNGVGKFTVGPASSNIGMDSGIVLSACGVDYVSNSNSSNSTHNCPTVSDAQLLNVVYPKSVNNCSVLEFDFIPKADTVKFRYVFASVEYYYYECTEFNDVFGFFISQGPDPSGSSGNYQNKNIATVPNKDTVPITISTVNAGQTYSSIDPTVRCDLTNSQYFRDCRSHLAGNVQNMQGMTTVLTAEAAVMPCQQYHLKMAIANVGDQSLPSAVFLEAKSLSSNGISFEFANRANPQNPSDLYEGCEATIFLSRPEATPSPTGLTVDFSGTATNGLDFAVVNQRIYFPADTTSFKITIYPEMDGLNEGIETALFTFKTDYMDACPDDSVSFNIIDVEPLSVTISHDSLTSSDYSTWLRSNIIGGMPNRAIEWKNLETGQVRYGDSIYVPTTTDTRWMLYVYDSCGNSAVDTMLVGLRHQFAFPYRDTVICADQPLDLFVRLLHNDLQDSCVWFRDNETTPFELNNDTVHLRPQESAKYFIHTYITWNGQLWEDVDSIEVRVVQLPEVSVSASSERICEGSSTTLTGTGAFEYSFDGDDDDAFTVSNTHTFSPDTTTLYYIYGKTADANCHGKDSVLIVVDTIPDIELGDGSGVCGGEMAELDVTTSAASFSWSAAPPDPSLGGQETRSHIIVNPASTTVYTVNAVNGVCTNSKSVTVAVEPMPIAIGEVTPRTVSLGEMEAVFSDVSQNTTTRRWEFPDGVVRTEREVSYIVPDDVDSVSVRLWAYNPYECFDTTTVTVYVDHTTIWIPNAFTPDESTNNTFLVKMNDIQRYHIFIYDRRGVLVYESYNPEESWDGTGKNGQKCPQGVYTYLISCHKITYPFEQIIRKGTVVLLR